MFNTVFITVNHSLRSDRQLPGRVPGQTSFFLLRWHAVRLFERSEHFWMWKWEVGPSNVAPLGLLKHNPTIISTWTCVNRLFFFPHSFHWLFFSPRFQKSNISMHFCGKKGKINVWKWRLCENIWTGDVAHRTQNLIPRRKANKQVVKRSRNKLLKIKPTTSTLSSWKRVKRKWY